MPVMREPYVGGARKRDNKSAMPVMATRFGSGRRADCRVVLVIEIGKQWRPGARFALASQLKCEIVACW
ncbi:hypothetical protein [Mycetohabitans sp. B46]|uniref:hypothetical protein n=1 Tax=Mycetohabitans sp. B46 TaxID=2772536 RepID=UPI00307D013B